MEPGKGTHPRNLERIPEAEWKLWYQDAFDLECPRQVELSGRGLVQGLTELWARHLFETIQPDGRSGFSRFSLWWKQGRRSLAIPQASEELARVRQWVYGNKREAFSGYVQAGDEPLLRAIATAHCGLVLDGATAEPILQAAAAATGREDFLARLMRLVRPRGPGAA